MSEINYMVEDLVDEISPTQRVLKDMVEYHWLVGCTPTAVSMVVGYWDRHGYGNLIAGDSSYYSDDVQDAIASRQHFSDYFNPMEGDIFTGPILPDASETGSAHKDNSLADFLLTSRSAEGLRFGATWIGLEGIGFHGYATYRGYDNFETEHEAWSDARFGEIAAEIDVGRPVVLAVDATGDGVVDHNVTVFGYDSATRQFLIHDGWVESDEPRWIDATGLANDHEFGIHSVTFIRPGEVMNSVEGVPNFFLLANDGSGDPSAYRAALGENNVFSGTKVSAEFPTGTKTVGVATADGHTFYQLYDDGSGYAALYKKLIGGGDDTYYDRLSSDSLIGRAAIDFATADGTTFYLLHDDGAGSAALYLSILSDNGTFHNTLLNSNCGLSRGTIGFSTSDGNIFYQLVNDGAGSASAYWCQIQSNGTFVRSQISADSGISRATIGMAAWDVNNPAIINGTALADKLYGGADDNTITGGDGTDQLYGGKGDDVLDGGAGNWDSVIYDGMVSDYTFTLNTDGSVAVKHGVYGTDTLVNIADVWLTGEQKLYALSELAQSAAVDGIIHGTPGDDALKGGDGDDVLIGGAGADALDGGAGFDLVSYENAVIGVVVNSGDWSRNTGDAAGDSYANIEGLIGGDHVDEIVIAQDDFSVWAGGGDDMITLVGSRGVAHGETGDDSLYGGAGGDRLNGNEGSDVIFGFGGDDMIEGGEGDDWLVGGTGNDLFVFHAVSGTDGIADFQTHNGAAGGDVIELHDQSVGDFDGLMANAAQWNGNATIALDDGDEIVLYGVALNELSADDFAFA